MAAKRNTITLEVLINSKDLAKELEGAFAASPKLVAAITKTVNPLEKGLDKVLGRQKAINTALQAGVKLTATIAKNYDAIAAKQKGTTEELRALGALAKLTSDTGRKARTDLAAKAAAATATLEAPGTAGKGKAANELIQSKAQLANVALKQKEAEEGLTKELENQVRAHIAIAKAQRDLSPESVERLVQLERELTALVNERSDDLVTQGKFAELLIRTESQLTEEINRGAKAGRARVDERRKELKLVDDLFARQSAIKTEIGLQQNIRQNAPDTAEGNAQRRAAITSEVALKQDLLGVQRQIEASEKKITAEVARREGKRLKQADQEFDRLVKQSNEKTRKGIVAFSELIRLEGQYEDQLRETSLTAEREIRLLDRLAKIRKVVASKSDNTDLEKVRQDELRNRVQSRITGSQNAGGAGQSREGLVELRRELSTLDLEAQEGSKQQVQTARLLLAVNKEIERIDNSRLATQKLISAQIADETKRLALRAQSEGPEGRKAVDELIARQKTYLDLLEDGSLESRREIEYRTQLLAIQRAINAASKGNQDASSRRAQQSGALDNFGKVLKAQPGGSDSVESLAAFNALKESVQLLENEIEGLDKTTKDYFDALDNLAKGKSLLGSKGAAEIDEETDAFKKLITEVKESIKLSRLGGETGRKYATQLAGFGQEAVANRNREQALLTDIRLRLDEINDLGLQGNDIEAEKLKLIQDQAAARKRLRQAEFVGAEVNSVAGRGSSRAALKANRRENGFDSYSALVDIGRVAQDAPYGFEGIANNIGPLIESMTLFYARVQEGTKGVGTLRTALGALGKDLLLTPIGIVALFNIIVLIVKALPKIVESIKEISKGFEQATTVAKKFKKEIAEETGKAFGEIVGEDDVQQTQKNVDSILGSISELRKSFIGDEDTTQNSGFINSLLLIDLKLAETGARAREFFGIATEQDTADLKIIDQIDQLDASLVGASKSLIESQANAKAFILALNSGTTEAFANSVVRQQESIKKATLETALAGARGTKEKVRITTQLFELETRSQKRQLQIQLKNQIEASKAIVAAILTQYRANQLNQAQRVEAVKTIRGQAELIGTLAQQVREFDDDRAGALQNEIDSIEKVKDKTDELAKALLSAVRAIQDLRNEIETLQNENSNFLEARQFDLRTNQLRIDARFREIQRRRAQEDFALEVKDLANRSSLIAQFNAQQSALRIAQARKDAIELNRIEEDRIAYETDIQRKYEDSISRVVDFSARELSTGEDDRARIEFEISAAQELLQIRRDIEDLDQKPDALFTAADREIVKSLRDELLIRERIQKQERLRLDLQLRVAAEQRRANEKNSIQALKDSIQESGTIDIFDSQERARKLASLTLQRETREINEDQLRREREISLIEDKEERDIQSEVLEQESLQRRNLAWETYYAALNEMQFRFFTDQQKAYVDFATQQIGSIDQTAQLLVRNAETRKRNQLDLEGKSQEEITEIIEKSGSKRRKIANTIAKANIVASTAVAAMDAFEGTLKAFKFLGPGAFPLAFAAAGTAIAFGKAQYDAVGLDSVRGGAGGAGGGSFTVGLDSAPGVQVTDPFTTADPFFNGPRGNDAIVISGMSDMAEKIEKLGARVMDSAATIAARPAYIGYSPDAASTLIKVGNDREALVTR